MKTLCLTADDFGVDPGVDDGILRCVAAGAIRNVSIWIDALTAPLSPNVAWALRACCLGLHWTLFPPSVDLNRPGDWPRIIPFLFPDRKTVSRQLERLDAGFACLSSQGLRPAFVNGHQHVHLLPTWITPLAHWAVRHGMRVMRQPRELGPGSRLCRLRRPALFTLEVLGKLGARIARHSDLCWIPALCRWGRSFPLPELDAALSKISAPALEVVVHPGAPTDAYLALSRSPIEFSGQVASLTSPLLPRIADQHGFRIGRLDEIA